MSYFERIIAELPRRCPLGEKKVELAKRMVKEIKAEEIPEDFDAGDTPYKLTLAHIRHQVTNYEALLFSLPLCTDYLNQSEENRQLCIEVVEASEQWLDGRCPWCEEAHDILKYAARDVAEIAYQHR